MPIPINLREEIDKATKLIEEGKESYGGASKRLGVGKATVYRRHIRLLTDEVTQLQRRKGKVQAELRGFEKSYGDLEAKYKEKRVNLEGAYKERRAHLEGAHQKLKLTLKREIETLKREKATIKRLLQAHGLSWDEGIQILKDIRDLRDERKLLKGGIAKRRAELSNREKEAKDSRSTVLQLKAQLSNLRRIIKREEGRFHILLGRISSAQDELYAIDYEKWDLRETVKAYEERKTLLEATVKKLTEDLRQLRVNVEELMDQAEMLTEKAKKLKAEKERLESEREEQIKKAKEVGERIVADAKTEAKKILADAEQKRNRISKAAKEDREKIHADMRAYAERLTKEVEGLKAERSKIRSQTQNWVKKAKEVAERIIVDAEQKSERILKEAEEERKRILAGAEEKRKKLLREVDELKAEKSLLESGVRMKIEELKQARKRLGEEALQREDAAPVPSYLPYFPKLPPLRVKKRAKERLESST